MIVCFNSGSRELDQVFNPEEKVKQGRQKESSCLSPCFQAALAPMLCLCFPSESVTHPGEIESSVSITCPHTLSRMNTAENLLDRRVYDEAGYTLSSLAVENYTVAGEVFGRWVRSPNSAPALESFFRNVKVKLDEMRFRENTSHVEKIYNLAQSVDSKMALDLNLLINSVIDRLKNLQIGYHNIQHTLEVTLATAQVMLKHFENTDRDPISFFQATIAALFHDIGYSNHREVLAYVKSVKKEDYEDLMKKAKGPDFVRDFEAFQAKLLQQKEAVSLTGAELHQYHVLLSQLLLPHLVTQVIPRPISGDFLFSNESIETMKCIIAQTDIKKDAESFKIECMDRLGAENKRILGQVVATCDLLTQLSTSNRLEKSLHLYHEFYLGGDAGLFCSGLELMSTTCGFYENFIRAHGVYNESVMKLLDKYFQERKTSNPYRAGQELVLCLHKVFEPLYKKLVLHHEISDEDILALNGLVLNGLQKPVLQLFQLAQSLKKPFLNEIEQKEVHDLRKSLIEEVLNNENSALEIAIGDEVRLTEMEAAAFFDEKPIRYINSLIMKIRKPQILLVRAPSVLSFFKQLKERKYDCEGPMVLIGKQLDYLPSENEEASKLRMDLKGF